jgi:hypothetical protein
VPEPIRSNVPGSFPESVLLQRHPAIVRQVRDGHPYPPSVRAALEALLHEVTTGVIEPVDGWGRAGERWVDQPFLWAEGLFYRKLLDAVGFFGPGPWQGIDPFGPQKARELSELPAPTVLPLVDALDAALWGNRADLSFRLLRADAPGHPALVADDRAAVLELLDREPGGTVCLIADNAGAELLADLLLIDQLLDSGAAARVELHLKAHPTFVSDATTADLVATLERVAASPPGQRLWAALTDGRLAVEAHPFFTAPLPYHELPADLAARFAEARLTIVKGDLNYRRLVGDLHWPPTASFQELTAYLPGGPVVALRTLKSDVVVGLAERTVAELDATDPGWRASGRYALVQLRA